MPVIASAPRSGFTILELMISIALGTVILFTAASGFRVLSQALTTSKRIGAENNLLRLGVQMTLDEVDFWVGSDDPNDPTKQPLRGSDGTGAAMPFTGFANDVDPVTGGAFEDSRAGLDESPSTPRGGWNPNPLAWAAWDPRTWTRANLPEKPYWTPWGSYDIFGSVDPTVAWHHWYDGQIRGLLDGLGFFGTYEYIPSNAFVIYHGSSWPAGAPGGMTWGGLPNCLIANGNWIAPPDGGDTCMKGRIRNTSGSRYYMPGPLAATPPQARGVAFVGYESRQGVTGMVNGAWVGGLNSANGYGDARRDPLGVTTFLNNTFVGAAELAQRPASWPNVTYEVHRFIERGHLVTACSVTCRSPVTGNYFVIPFTCIGTTLRGARQQRRPVTGWADPYTDATLDYGTPP